MGSVRTELYIRLDRKEETSVVLAELYKADEKPVSPGLAVRVNEWFLRR